MYVRSYLHTFQCEVLIIFAYLLLGLGSCSLLPELGICNPAAGIGQHEAKITKQQLARGALHQLREYSKER